MQMAGVCMPQTSYQQQHRFINSNNNNMMLQQQYHQEQQQQRVAGPTTKILGNSNLQNIQQQQPQHNANIGPMSTKKKYTYLNMPFGEQLPSVARRNARERNRVKQVNNGFTNLRQHLPQTVINSLSNGGRGASKKLSKVDTLRIAVEYIRSLQDLLEDCSSSTNGSVLQLDDSSNDGSNYGGYSSIGSPVDGTQFQLTHSYNSEASASPSYSDSDASIGGGNYLNTHHQNNNNSSSSNSNQQMQFKFEPFDTYHHLNGTDDDEQADDEELLDYISSWQEQ